MAEAANFTIGTLVSCPDGPCGEVTRIVINPEARTVTHLVVAPKHRRKSGRLVPLHLVDATGTDLVLRCTLAEFDLLDPAEEEDFVEGAGYEGGYGYDAVQGYGNVGSYGIGGSVSGMSIGGSLGHRRPTVSHDNVPLGETEVCRGERVHAVDGEIGRVEGFVIDPNDQRVTHVLLQEGHLWGRKEVAIPMSALTGLDDGVRLNLTRQQVADLPPVH